MSSDAPPVLSIHTPSSSFAIVHSLSQESLTSLYDKLTRKAKTDYHGERVGPGWLKYEFNDTIWNLDDESDYTIYVWRQQQSPTKTFTSDTNSILSQAPSTSTPVPSTPTLHLHNPRTPLPVPPAYLNPAYYLFQPSRAQLPVPSTRSHTSATSGRSKKKGKVAQEGADGVPKFKKEFEKFHSENGVRTVIGSIGPVDNVRMLLKSGYRHVYISRKFAVQHGFIPSDSTPGHYGYSGLVNIGSWPITLVPSSAPHTHSAHLAAHPAQTQTHLATPATAGPHSRSPSPATSSVRALSATSSPSITGAPFPPGGTLKQSTATTTKKKKKRGEGEPDAEHPSGLKPTYITVYLSEEPHFDVVLGRSFFEKRLIKTSSIDPTDVVCMDTGEKIECELVILKDGRGEIVTVT